MNIKVNEIKQGKSKYYFGKMKFSELEKFVCFSIRTVKNEKGINRETDLKRIKDIAKYLQENKKSKIPLFSTPLVIAIDERDGIKLTNNVFFLEDKEKEIFLIIDGQHRFKGIEYYIKNFDNNFDLELPIIFLFNFDVYELSEIFVNINFKQKPVNKSLYYDIFGSLPPKDGKYNELQYSHEIVKTLNNYDFSPIKGIIKMLGNEDGLISQSFIVDIFTLFFRKDNVWGKFLEKQDKNSLEKFLMDYFSFIKEKFSDYNYIENDGKFDTGGHILWKTTGFGAILYLIQDIFQDPLFDINGDINKYLKSKFSKLTDEDIKTFFSKDGEYAGSGGLQSKLYREISKIIFYNSGKEILKNKLINDYKVGESFKLGDLYLKYKDVLKQYFPDSNTIEAKIRRLLQILRDEGYIEFLGKRNYKLINS